VGLKLLEVFVAEHRLPRSNRTIVGLKHTNNGMPIPMMAWQQSHHCGIETSQ